MEGMNQATIMALCPDQLFDVPENLKECFWQFESGQEVLEIMRVFPVDLLLVSLDIPDVDIWQFIKTVKIKDSKIKWILLCHQIDPETEVKARTLGVFRIFQAKPDVNELYKLAVVIRQRNRDKHILA